MELTIEDINLLLEAVDAWTISSKTSSLLGGLVFGALVAKSGNSEASVDMMKSMMNGEDDKEKNRKEIAIVLKAKLLKMRDRLVIDEAKVST